MRIAVLNPGAMGAAVGAQLVQAGHDVVWLPAGRGRATRTRADDAGLSPADSVDGCDAVLSVVPPGAAEDVVESVGRFTGLYVDLNAIDPDTAATVHRTAERNGAVAVDGGIVGPPPQRPAPPRVFLSGDQADRAAALFSGTVIDTVVLTASPAAASAVKMAYGAWTKGSAALLLAVHATAEHYGVADALDAEWERSQPELPQRLEAARAQAAAKGWRWVAEMDSNARTFEGAAQPGGFGQAAAEIYGRYERPST